MKRLLLLSLIAAVLVPAVAAATADPRATEPFTVSATGSVIANSSRQVLDLTGMPDGAGAGSLRLKSISGGTLSKGTLYDDNGSLTIRYTSSFSAPASDGSRKLTGTGTFVEGSGAYVNPAGSFTVTGTRTADGVDTLHFKGRVRHDVQIVLVKSGRGQ